MATVAGKIQRRKFRRTKPKLVVIHGGKELSSDEGNALLLEWSNRFAENRSRMAPRYARIERLPVHRRSVERAMLVVEEAFVKAMWVLQCTEGGDGPIGYVSGGIGYSHDQLDRYVQALANGGWQTPAPRPAIPSAKEITAAENAHLWVRFLDPAQARVLTVGAMSKRGDAGRKVAWMRVRPRLPEFKHHTVRHLQGIYTGALREIVARLTADQVRMAYGA